MMYKFFIMLVLISSSSFVSAYECLQFTKKTKPFDIYEIPEDNPNVVIDKQTQLMWTRCPIISVNSNNTYINEYGDCKYNSPRTWDDALQLSVNSSLAGFTDWRIPNVKELYSIVEEACFFPSTNVEIFPYITASNSSSIYFNLDTWTSTPDTFDWDKAFYMSFGVNAFSSIEKSELKYVRLVRSISSEELNN